MNDRIAFFLTYAKLFDISITRRGNTWYFCGTSICSQCKFSRCNAPLFDEDTRCNAPLFDEDMFYLKLNYPEYFI